MTTFGDSALGGTSSYTIDNNVFAGYFQMGSNGGTGDSITALLKVVTWGHKVKCAIYKSDLSLLSNGVTEEITVTPQAATATTFDFVGTKPSLSADAWYYIAIWAENAAGTCSLYTSTSGGDGIFSDETSYNGFPDPYGPLTQDVDGLVSIYCTYTETGGGVTTTFNTIVGSPTGWSWGTATIDTSTSPRSPTQNGLGWIWGTVSDTSSSYIPSGQTTGWNWCVENAGQ